MGRRESRIRAAGEEIFRSVFSFATTVSLLTILARDGTKDHCTMKKQKYKTKKTNKKKPFFPLISSHEHTSKQQETSSTPVHAATPATPDRTTPSLP